MEDKKKKLYTLLVYSENVAGILNQVTAVFTRRQVNRKNKIYSHLFLSSLLNALKLTAASFVAPARKVRELIRMRFRVS